MISNRLSSHVKSSVAPSVLAVLFCVIMASPVCAQGWGANPFSLGSIECIFGPLIPAGGLGNSFRSEVSAGIASTIFDKALLKSGSAKVDLVSRDDWNQIDTHPVRYDVRANVRFWRFGFRGAYCNLESSGIAKYDFSGLILAGDFDVVQFQWLAFGACADFYFIDPRFHGRIVTPSLITNAVDLKGDRPITYGGYMRYMPPEILGFPVYFEAYIKAPLKKNGSLTSLSAALVFRPQVYRFDAFARLTAEKNYLKFEDTAQINVVSGNLNGSGTSWEMNMEWKAFALEMGIYF